MLKARIARAAQSLRRGWKQHLATLALAWVAIVAVDSWRAPKAFSSPSIIFSIPGTALCCSMNSATGWKKLRR